LEFLSTQCATSASATSNTSIPNRVAKVAKSATLKFARAFLGDIYVDHMEGAPLSLSGLTVVRRKEGYETVKQPVMFMSLRSEYDDLGEEFEVVGWYLDCGFYSMLSIDDTISLIEENKKMFNYNFNCCKDMYENINCINDNKSNNSDCNCSNSNDSILDCDGYLFQFFFSWIDTISLDFPAFFLLRHLLVFENLLFSASPQCLRLFSSTSSSFLDCVSGNSGHRYITPPLGPYVGSKEIYHKADNLRMKEVRRNRKQNDTNANSHSQLEMKPSSLLVVFIHPCLLPHFST
jgi:hypothetical protein